MKNESVISNIEDLKDAIAYVAMSEGLISTQTKMAVVIGENKFGDVNGYLQVSYSNETLANIKISDEIVKALMQTKAKADRRMMN